MNDSEKAYQNYLEWIKKRKTTYETLVYILNKLNKLAESKNSSEKDVIKGIEEAEQVIKDYIKEQGIKS